MNRKRKAEKIEKTVEKNKKPIEEDEEIISSSMLTQEEIDAFFNYSKSSSSLEQIPANEKGKEKLYACNENVSEAHIPPKKRAKPFDQSAGLLKLSPWIETGTVEGPHGGTSYVATSRVSDPGCGVHAIVETKAESKYANTILGLVTEKKMAFENMLDKVLPEGGKNWLIKMRSVTPDDWFAVVQQKIYPEFEKGKLDQALLSALALNGLSVDMLGDEADKKFDRIKNWLEGFCMLVKVFGKYTK
jgi:hypothetical protein